MQLPTTRTSRAIDAVIRRIGEAIAWVWLILLAVIVCNVVARYAFDQGRIEFEELQWHLYSIGMLLGLSYCYVADEHIRVDALSERFSPRLRAWIELYGSVFLLLPFIALVVRYGIVFATESFRMNEVSVSPGGLPLRWLIKAVLPLGFALLLAAVISRLSRVWAFLFGPHSAADHAD
jgi:TRAP-type mannitol/chloroaromatic compound transport system permease small subunit